MRVYKRPGSPFWQFEFEVHGNRYRGSTKTKNERQAGQIASAKHADVLRGEAGITERKRAPSLGDAFAAFLDWSLGEHHAHPRTTHRYQVSSRPLLKHFSKTRRLDSISSADVEAYKSQRAKQKGERTGRILRPATVNREIAALRAMYTHAGKALPHLVNPTRGVNLLDEANQQERVVTYGEEAAYLAVATPTLRDVAGLMFELGLRPNEACELKRSSVDLQRGFLRVEKGKTPSARRRLDLTPEADRILRGRLAGPSESPYVFACETDSNRPLPKVNNAHDRAIRDSGVPHFKLYAARHTFATRAAEAGIDLLTLAALLGHSRVTLVQRYAHIGQAHQSSAMQILVAHNAKRSRSDSSA